MNLSHCYTSQLNLKHSKSHCTLNPSALTEINSAPKSLTTADQENGKKMKMKILHPAAKPGGKTLTHAAHERHQQSAAPAVYPHQTERPQPRCLQQSAVHVCQTGYICLRQDSCRLLREAAATPLLLLSIPSQPSRTSPIRFSSSAQ
ncbi:hypothetical protein DPX16_12671 [Anabarilius grahami]|uniref:Uncharacterized protein n=1 Tax=Anabarilius grahami TaxID=495550 RepID=A0A3N0XTB8_ANAGA|nr:hypothetical protein DPX16_12671 [Anabarilius grahami]